jgi:hypothetical protein
VAAVCRRELKIDVEMVHGRYGEFNDLVDGETVFDGGAWGMPCVSPSSRKVVEAVRVHPPS